MNARLRDVDPTQVVKDSNAPDEHSGRIRALQAMLDYVLAEGAELNLAHFVTLLRAASIVLEREID